MNDKEDKTYCTIDHSNKLGDGRKFDAYQYWLNQSKRRKEIEALARKKTTVSQSLVTRAALHRRNKKDHSRGTRIGSHLVEHCVCSK